MRLPPKGGVASGEPRGRAMDEIRFLHRQAEDCRRAARDVEQPLERRGLQQLADHYEREARRLNLAELKARL
jgi:hypothetical protein